MPDPRLYESDTYVLLEPGQEEQFVAAAEVLRKLESILANRQDDLPPDLEKFASIQDQAQYLLESSCDFEVEPGTSLQWYVVRLEK